MDVEQELKRKMSKTTEEKKNDFYIWAFFKGKKVKRRTWNIDVSNIGNLSVSFCVRHYRENWNRNFCRKCKMNWTEIQSLFRRQTIEISWLHVCNWYYHKLRERNWLVASIRTVFLLRKTAKYAFICWSKISKMPWW